MVKSCMRKGPYLLLQSLVLAIVSACATGVPLEKPPELGGQEIWEKLGCAESEVAICIAVHCRDDDWVCADRDALRGLFSPHRSN